MRYDCTSQWEVGHGAVLCERVGRGGGLIDSKISLNRLTKPGRCSRREDSRSPRCQRAVVLGARSFGAWRVGGRFSGYSPSTQLYMS